MILECIRFTADALANGVIGVNAQLQSIETDAGDAKPPPIHEVVDVTRHDQAAREEPGPDGPLLIVSQDTESQTVPRTGPQFQDGDVSVMVLYWSRGQDPARRVQDAHYTLRAARKTVRARLNQPDRTRNGVQVLNDSRIDYVPVFGDVGGGFVSGGLRVVYRVRDTKP